MAQYIGINHDLVLEAPTLCGQIAFKDKKLAYSILINIDQSFFRRAPSGRLCRGWRLGVIGWVLRENEAMSTGRNFPGMCCVSRFLSSGPSETVLFCQV